MLVRAIADLAAVARECEVSVRVTREHNCEFSDPIEAVADQVLEVRSTPMGPRFVGEEFETLVYELENGWVQPILAFWRNVLEANLHRTLDLTILYTNWSAMEPNIERSDHRSAVDLEHGLGALRQCSEFGDPVEPSDDHEHPKDHLALIYESREEQFATVIPFIRRGIEQGERCLYVVDENSREEVLEAMRTRGINVDAALDSGALTIHAKEDTYLKNGEFDPDEMIAHLTDTISEALEEYEGLRATGEMTWVLGDEPRAEDFMEYESKLTSLYSHENAIGLCQYNRERFPPEVIRSVISTHPYLIHDNVVSQNVYYTPPEEFLGPDQPASEVDRMLETLRDRTETKADLEDRQRFLHESYKITSNPERSFEEKLEQLLDLGREWFGLEMAVLSELPSWDGKFRLEKGIGLGVEPDEKPIWTDPGEGCFCRQTITEDTPVSQVDVRETQWADDSIYQEFGLTSYLGTRVTSGSTPYGTLWFGSTKPRERPFSDTERTFLELMGQWVSYEIERREHKRSQRELYEITADTERTFDEKLQAVFDLGCDRFDLDLGGVARIDPDTDLFEVETMSGEHDYLVPGEQYPLSETYCQLVTDEGETAGVTDPVSRGFDGKLCYEQFGFRAYLGTHFGLEGGDGRTFFFLSDLPRETEFSEAERTFLHLMGQWVQYEFERRQRGKELRERTEHLSALVETTPDCIKTVAEDGTLLQMNPAGLEMGEADSESDVVGECVYDLVAPDHRERYREFNERICRGERGTLEFDIVGLEGTRRHMESHAAPLDRPDGTTVQVAVTRDVTEQVEREQELERALDLLNKSERIADVAGWEVDPDTREPYWSDHLFEILDVEYDEQPTLEEALDVYHTEHDRAIVEDAVEEALETSEPFDVEVRFPRPDGDVGWLRVQGDPEIEDGEVVSLRGAVQDITERKQREQQLEEVIDKLETSNDRLKQFAYAASHDLKEPLRMVSSYMQLLENQYRDELDEDAQEYIDFAVDGADRMREMVDDLLAYSRVEQSDGKFRPVECDAILEQVTDDLQVQIEENDAEIRVDSLPTITADSEQVEQLFQNLLSNAIKYSGDEPPRIEISAERRTDMWRFSVADNGIGIDPEKTDHIFEVFKRLHHDDEYAGTGIGLSLCQEIVENHDGEIWVESEPGEGSTFSFTLPDAYGD